MACAMSSLPVPVSPSMRTVESVEATCSTWSRTDSRAALLPMIDSNFRSGGSASGYVTVAYSSTQNLLSRDAIFVAVSFTDQVLLGPFRATGGDPPVSPGTRLRPLSSLESASLGLTKFQKMWIAAEFMEFFQQQSKPQTMMSCASSAYFGSPCGLASCCKTYSCCS